ncbi:hypothetical protein Ssed_0030 [Shewanella sediminis HAW-EB3]|uniref:Uncharacterized protein n=1 Tax=Shewanella sediminis (strain HAW-EB3) TaxID=425104 RepID=A8FP70_SHESH|nr:hypothetical protein [Shewanella sediminis]ABV34643.1 hypothetical protein Ssed_0030 [Shewanella sediminis HAW-EB3]
MNFSFPNKMSIFTRVFQLILCITLIFILAKLFFEAGVLGVNPILKNIVFISSCLAIGWIFKIKYYWNYQQDHQDHLSVILGINLFGFSFVKIFDNGILVMKHRGFWKKQLNLDVNSSLTVTVRLDQSQSPSFGCLAVKNSKQLVST